MGGYRLLFKPSAERAFLALPRDMQKRLDKRLLALRENLIEQDDRVDAETALGLRDEDFRRVALTLPSGRVDILDITT